MALDLGDAVHAAIRLVGTLAGMRGSPTEPPEKISVFPFSLAYPLEGEGRVHSRGNRVDLHTIAIEVHTSRKDLPRDMMKVVPYGQLILDLFLDPANSRLPDAAGNPTITELVMPVRYEFRPLGYVTVGTLGYRFFLDVKIQGV